MELNEVMRELVMMIEESAKAQEKASNEIDRAFEEGKTAGLIEAQGLISPYAGDCRL